MGDIRGNSLGDGPSTRWAVEEMAGAVLWDGRVRATLSTICERLADQPATSLSRALGSQRKSASRILHNGKVSAGDLLRGHVLLTEARSIEYCEHTRSCEDRHRFILIASDTTVCNFSTHHALEGLGPISDNDHDLGVFVHSGFAMTRDGVPLGLLSQRIWARDPKEGHVSERRRTREYIDKESYKWLQAERDVEGILSPDVHALLIQDREADIYDFFSAPRSTNIELLIRAGQARSVEVISEQNDIVDADDTNDMPETLLEAAAKGTVVGHKNVSIYAHPNHKSREAHLTIRLLRVCICAPRHSDQPASELLPSVPVWMVQASEETPPPDVEKPVSWTLLTTLPEVDQKDAFDLVNYYALRWRIERFHYTLKSGCNVEHMQCDTFEAIQKAMSLYSIVSWRLMWMLYLVREDPDAPADLIVSPTEAEVLQLHTGKDIHTARDAVLAIAKVGGFVSVPSAPMPGVKSMWLGMRRFSDLLQGYRLAKTEHRQSLWDK